MKKNPIEQNMTKIQKAPRKIGGIQAKKSESTRIQVINSAIQCLLKYGYSKTTMSRIAEEANISRGAMMHHYSNRLTVMQNVIQHLHEKRLRAFRRAVTSNSNQKTSIHATLTDYWNQVNRPLFIAFEELSMAARTDPDLDLILSPARTAFNEEWYKMAVTVFPDWKSGRKNFDLALRLCQNMMDGMAINVLNGSLDQSMIESLLQHLEGQIRTLKNAKN
ncbi:MAG: TetR/AcrR family transcriptional regulator [Emcibacter sp.]|nr:TetR/AcrR family transcriptional regulator [Emcibacter sp.]